MNLLSMDVQAIALASAGRSQIVLATFMWQKAGLGYPGSRENGNKKDRDNGLNKRK
jgi:hypothetical protein